MPILLPLVLPPSLAFLASYMFQPAPKDTIGEAMDFRVALMITIMLCYLEVRAVNHPS